MARSKGYRNLLAYLVLNLLVEAPMHPYQMKRLIHLRGKDQLIAVNLQSLYHAIEQLERAGLIESVEINREGRRPERTVYRATEAGLEELEGWMAELLGEVPPGEFPRVIAALAHLPVMRPAEVRRHLEQRALVLEVQIASTEAALRVGIRKLPRVLIVEGEFAVAMKRAELEWVRALIDDLAAGRLTWDPEELLGLAAGGEGEATMT
jgi:DNA-binding PadR family transcriptional regulator